MWLDRLRDRRDRGVSTVEWGAVILVVAAVVGAVVVSNLPAELAAYTKSAVCEVAQGSDCADTTGTGDGGTAGGRDEGDQPQPNPTSNPTGAATTGPGGDEPLTSVEREYQDAQREKDAADEEAESAETDFGDIKNELLDLVKGLVGIDDIEKCITEGDIGACLWALAGALPLGKALKFVKLIPKLGKFLLRTKKIWDRLNKARKRRKDAADRLRRAEDACKGKNSFVPGTLVVLADGSRKPIEDVDIGDLVWAADPATGNAAARPVTALISGTGTKQLVDVSVDPDGIAGQGRPVTLTATSEHPFWVDNGRRWVDAGDLSVGDRLRTAAGTSAVVLRTRDHTRARQRAYNITVDGLHTYYVAAGRSARPVLVHNAQPTECFRGARPGAKPDLTPRPNDYKVDAKTGFVKETHGVSVFDNAPSVSGKGFVPHQIDMSSVPPTLRIIQRGQDKRHFEIVPSPGANLTPERYAEELRKIKFNE